MCGISGVIHKDNTRVNQGEMKQMNDLIAHRGPDDEGVYFAQHFAFGHRRLSILDLSEDGHQPMHYLNKYTITYNGEIYNYLEIREVLENDGYQFCSDTDTEVILASYDKWGEACVNQFNGMWAFAIYDKEKALLFCSRDRFGVKPFYYTEVEGKFVFGSEIKQLLTFYKEKYVNETILVDYLLYGLEEHTNETFFDNIYKLEQSHNLIYDLRENSYVIKRYFDIAFDTQLDALNETESIDCLKKQLIRSIDLRLRSDVKVGTCLSGGLDSSSIAAIASSRYFDKTNEQFVAIHAKSIEKKTDESHFAWEVVSHCNLNMVEVEPQLEDITDNVEEVVYTQEEPFGGPSIFMQYFVMKKAREQGCIVMLDGQGGDETLFGYEGYFSFYFAALLSKLRFVEYWRELKGLSTFKVSKKRIFRDSMIILFRNQLSFIEKFVRKKKMFIKLEHNRKRLNHLFVFNDFKRFQKREIMLRNLPHLLRYEDKNAMRHSVETRLPFVDFQFVQTSVSLNDSLKFRNGYLKYILRKVVDTLLPEKIVWRRNKFGFEAPTDLWIESHRGEMIHMIESSALIKYVVELNTSIYNNTTLLWKLYNIAVWEKVYDVKIKK